MIEKLLKGLKMLTITIAVIKLKIAEGEMAPS